MTRVPVMLTIAGSDPSGGAGIQADLKTATAMGVYGASVITALTAQNTMGVSGVWPVPIESIEQQYDAVVSDLDVRAVKIGMLGTAEVVRAVAGMLTRCPVPVVVLDPVMVATSGDRLIPLDAVATIRDLLMPLSTVVTPNLAEARELTGLDIVDGAGMEAAGKALRELGAGTAVIKGGHFAGNASDDVVVGPGGATWLRATRIDTPNTHGTGCTLSSAIASRLAVGDDVLTAITAAKVFLGHALTSGKDLVYGQGHGPVDHLIGRTDS